MAAASFRQNASLYLRQLGNELKEQLNGKKNRLESHSREAGKCEWIFKLFSDSLVLESITMKFRITVM